MPPNSRNRDGPRVLQLDFYEDSFILKRAENIAQEVGHLK